MKQLQQQLAESSKAAEAAAAHSQQAALQIQRLQDQLSLQQQAQASERERLSMEAAQSRLLCKARARQVSSLELQCKAEVSGHRGDLHQYCNASGCYVLQSRAICLHVCCSSCQLVLVIRPAGSSTCGTERMYTVSTVQVMKDRLPVADIITVANSMIVTASHHAVLAEQRPCLPSDLPLRCSSRSPSFVS